MVTFNNELEIARNIFLKWTERSSLKNVTIVRDVFGKLSFLIESDIYPDQQKRDDVERLLQRNLGVYYTGKTYWDKMPSKDKKYLQPILNLMLAERSAWIEDCGIQFYISERPIAKKAWAVCRRAQNAVWPYEDAYEGKKAKVITFYSFKGGMGRTTALASVALQLVKKGKNVCMVDMDIEAPGLATLFFGEESITNGVLDYLLEHAVQGSVDIGNYVKAVRESSLLDEKDGEMYVMPAGRVDENYLQKLARIDYQDHREGALRSNMCDMLRDIDERYKVDYILIDSRAGFHDIGGIAVAQLPHGAVLFGNDSVQSWDGLTQVIRTISQSHEDNVPILLVDCMCDSNTAPSFAAIKEHFLTKAYTIFTENYYAEGEALPGKNADNEPHSPVFLPYDEALRREVVLYSTGSEEEDERVKAFAAKLQGEAYKMAVGRIEAWFGEGARV